MRNIILVVPILVFAAFAGLALSGLMREDSETLESQIIGNPAPEVMMDTLGDKATFVADDLKAADITVLNFWASWCAPCRAEHPHLQTLSAAGLPVYGINYRDNADNALSFLDELGDPFDAVGADPRGRMAVNWGVYGLPETFLIAKDGTVLYRLAGPLTQRIWDNRVKPALADKGITLPPL